MIKQNIKEKVLKEEIEETKEQLRLIEEEHTLPIAVDKRTEYNWWVNAIVNIKMVERAKLLAEVSKVIDDWFNKNKVLLRGSIPAMISKHGFSLEDIKELKQKLGIK